MGTPKTKSSTRDIPITTKIYNILIEVYQNSNSEFVISSSQSFVSPRSYEYRFKKKIRQLGIADVNYHALRHTFATRCIEKGIDVKTLSEILGHSNVGITLNTYVHSSMALKREQLEKLN
jgi:integrase